MANVVISDSHLENIATAIRYKLDSEATYKPREMAAAIRAIPTATTIIQGDVNAFIDKSIKGSVSLSCETIGEFAFYNMNNITSISSNTVYTVKEDGINNCSALASLNLQNATLLERKAINNCFLLESINLPSLREINNLSIANATVKTLEFQVLNIIRSGAFFYLPELTKVDLGSEIETIECEVFVSCDKLTTIIMRCSAPSFYDVDGPFPENFRTDYTGDSQGYVYVPAAHINDYQSKKYWNLYNYRAIEDYPGI